MFCQPESPYTDGFQASAAHFGKKNVITQYWASSFIDPLVHRSLEIYDWSARNLTEKCYSASFVR